MFAKTTGTLRYRATIIATLNLLAVSVAAVGAYVAFAEEPVPQVQTGSAAYASMDVEQAFWACDYVGTTHGVQAAPVAFCSEATTTLIQQKFGGDFEQMLEWWRQNKAAQHGRFEAASVANVAIR